MNGESKRREFRSYTRKTAEDEKDWDRTLNRYSTLGTFKIIVRPEGATG
jgi:hypothetical protein